MEIKRYSESVKADKYGMREDPTGEFYSRADLIAAGCLVPVPDGEAMGGYWNCERCAGKGGWTSAPDWEWDDCPTCKGRGRVRLVPMEDVEREPHDKYTGKAPHDVRGWEPN